MTSDRTAHRLSRLLAMLPWVMANPGVTVEEVCSRFGYERQGDLIKDLELVFLCGLPGYGPGDLMDATLLGDEVIIEDADYFSRPLRLSAAEALVLLAAGTALLGSSSAPPALESAVVKLTRVVAPEEGAVQVDLGSEPAVVAPLQEAAAEGRVVRIEYTALGTGATTTRDIEPWQVFSSLGNWYVSGHCRLAGAERTFRLDRIRSLEETGEGFPPPTARPAPAVAYSPSADDAHAVIELSPSARWVSEYYPVTVLAEDEGSQTIDFAATDPEVIARLLLRLGPEASLLEGEAARAAVADLRRRVLARYE